MARIKINLPFTLPPCLRALALIESRVFVSLLFKKENILNAHFNSLLKKILEGQRAIPVSWVVTRGLFDVSAWIAVRLRFDSALAENPLLRLSRPVLGPPPSRGRSSE
jgi:hypothetical protein